MTGERYAYHLLKSDPSKTEKLADSLKKLHENTKYCPITFALIDKNEEVSALYSDNRRDKKIIAIVEDAFDVVALEKTAQFNGTYHVLGGLISPIDGITPESLHVDALIKRVESDAVKEVILATSSSVEGDLTANYISEVLKHTNVKVSRLARGLPIGLDLEYADQITLGRALEGRQAI